MYFIDTSDGILKFRLTYDLSQDTVANTYTLTLQSLNLASNGLTGRNWHMSTGYFVINGQTVSRTTGTVIFTVANSSLGYSDSNNIAASSMYSPIVLGPFSYNTYPTIQAQLVQYYFRWVPSGSGNSGNPHKGTVSATTIDGGTLVAPQPHSHSYSSVVTAPTCLTSGYTTYTCSCGDSYTGNPKAALGHNYISTIVEPSCLGTGYTSHDCSRCDSSYIDNIQDPLGHSYSDSILKEATCQTEGSKKSTCGRCGDTQTFTIAILPHDYIKTTIASTCIAQGYDNYTCSMCQGSYQNNFQPLGNHVFEDTEDGQICSICGLAINSIYFIRYKPVINNKFQKPIIYKGNTFVKHVSKIYIQPEE